MLHLVKKKSCSYFTTPHQQDYYPGNIKGSIFLASSMLFLCINRKQREQTQQNILIETCGNRPEMIPTLENDANPVYPFTSYYRHPLNRPNPFTSIAGAIGSIVPCPGNICLSKD